MTLLTAPWEVVKKLKKKADIRFTARLCMLSGRLVGLLLRNRILSVLRYIQTKSADAWILFTIKYCFEWKMKKKNISKCKPLCLMSTKIFKSFLHVGTIITFYLIIFELNFDFFLLFYNLNAINLMLCWH